MDIGTNEYWTKSPLSKNMKAAAVTQDHERQNKEKKAQ